MWRRWHNSFGVTSTPRSTIGLRDFGHIKENDLEVIAMDYLMRANELQEEFIQNRRHLHKYAQVGMNLEKTADFVAIKLMEMGIEVNRPIASGVVATIGQGEKTILLRADMDALPMREESGLDFASEAEAAHTCGHDLHTAMLLGAAKLLKENEEKIKGTVKLMFQPGEEIFAGAKAMIAAGVLENPKPDVALAYHVGPGSIPLGLFMYNDTSALMYANDGFRITIKGKGAHGSYPQDSIDPINIGAHIYTALQEILAREVDPSIPSVLTIGKFQSGTAGNIIPETAVLEGSIRTPSKEMRELMLGRLKEITQGIAMSFRGVAEVEMLSQVPPLICNSEFTKDICKYMSELEIQGQMPIPDTKAQASDDFAVILDQIPGCYIFLSAGFPGEEIAPSHNPKVRFNEGVLPQGAAYFAHCATRWLEENSK